MDSITAILKVVAPISVALIVFAQGLSISPSVVARYFKERPGGMLLSLVVVLVLVPAAALALILILKPAAGVAIGLAILVACPPAPLMISAAPMKGSASAPFMAGMHLTLATLAFLTVPISIGLLSIPLGFHADVDMGVMAWTLARTILLPIGLGLIVRARFAESADRLGPVLGKAGHVGLLAVVLLAVVALYPALLNMDAWSYLVMVAVCATALSIGHVLGPRDPHEKTALAVECAVRHPVLALAIGSMNFSPQKALPVLVPCVLTFIAVAMVYMILRRKGGGS